VLRPDRAPAGDQVAELLGTKALQARPERDVGVLRLLSLQADKPLDQLERRLAGARQQALAGQQRPVQGARTEERDRGRRLASRR
jgi:hypothetical protein